MLTALLEYVLEMASTHGILRIFAKVEDEEEREEVGPYDLFQKVGFQRYARQLTLCF